MTLFLWLILLVAGVGAIVWGAETFAEHLGKAAVVLGVSSFALALLLAEAEPEKPATAAVASLRGSPGTHPRRRITDNPSASEDEPL
ncbi:MAG TPA: hypothetical protein VND66_01135 [Acidobacteriaceae bacterium]|nr:hypothetical protein [Terriglobia bacterium]HVC89199.1 hypothetical protein [Acidobacteriaceae bacterium]